MVRKTICGIVPLNAGIPFNADRGHLLVDGLTGSNLTHKTKED